MLRRAQEPRQALAAVVQWATPERYTVTDQSLTRQPSSGWWCLLISFTRGFLLFSCHNSFNFFGPKTGLEIRPVFAKLRFWVCRTLEFFAWVFEKNQGFLKKSYVNWSRILSLVNRFWIFIGISNDSFLKLTLRSFLPIFRFFFVWNFVESLSFTLELLSFSLEFWVFFSLSYFQNVEFLSLT